MFIVSVETKIDSSIHMGEILPKQYFDNVVRVGRKRGWGGVIIAANYDYICAVRLLSNTHSAKLPG